jgi:hypothetical protein
MNPVFRDELESLLNRNSCENESNTPDWILANYLSSCLAAFDAAVRKREEWYGRDPNRGPAQGPGGGSESITPNPFAAPVQTTAVDPFERGRMDCVQDLIENAPFASIGGLVARDDDAKRATGEPSRFKCPTYITAEEWPLYRRGYEGQAEHELGADWRTCEFTWHPAMTIGGKS